MRKLIYILLAVILLYNYSCDDGDIVSVELDFENTFNACGVNDLVLYKTKDDPSESLSLKISQFTIEDLLKVDTNNLFEKTITLSSSNPFNYRTYSNTRLPNDLFCNDIPNSEVQIIDDVECTSGTAELKTILTQDDLDDIETSLEDINNNGDFYDDDTDGDTLPNFLDADDDGDNILTKNENPDPNGDGDLSDAQDTDGDSIPDYLDADDDGDGIDTRDEENDSQDNNPANDITNSASGPDYLNPDVANLVPATAYREHTISRSYIISVTLRNIDLELISYDTFDFGTLETSEIPSNFKTIKITPDFN